MKVCNRCVLSETMPHITFDSNGVCNYCRDFKKIEYKGEKDLLKLLDQYRNSENKYDCIVTISGGRDSTYTLLKMVKDYKMKVLAVNYLNPFTDPVAKKNIENAVKCLNVDLIQFQLENNIHEKTFKHNFNVWWKNPNPALIPMLCISCKTIWYTILKIAKQHEVHCIISGGNPYEDTSFKKVLLKVASDEKIENSFAKAILGIILETSKNPAYYHPSFIPTLIKGYLFGDPYCPGSRFFGRDVSKIDLFQYIEWNENEIISRIKNELDWDSPHDLASTWRFDCYVGHLKEYLYLKTIGVTEQEDFFAKKICQGILTREDALLRLKKENMIHFDYIETLLKQVGFKDVSFLYDESFFSKEK
jgi:hypothetical protein